MSQKILVRRALIGACVLVCASMLVGASGCRGRLHQLKGMLLSAQAALPKRKVHYTHTKSAKPKVPLGMNLSGIVYYSTAVPFVDVMKMADDFHSLNVENVPGGKNEWDSNLADKIPRDELGYPLEAPSLIAGAEAPQKLIAPVAVPIYTGRYTLLYDGDGEVEFPASSATVTPVGPGRATVEFANHQDPFFIAIKRSNRSNHVRNIRIYVPGFDGSDPKAEFQPEYLERLRGVSTLRFMDWGSTNGSKVVHWEDRTTPAMFQGTWRGASFESAIDLANALDADPWICIPHQADDKYIDELAKLVKARLDPKHRVYLEYSNELWNGIFAQSMWASEQGCKAGLNKIGVYSGDNCGDSGTHYWAMVKWNARRSGKIFSAFERAFGGSDRLVRVLSGQGANSDLNDGLLASFYDPEVNPLKGQVDALAIAPYVGPSLADDIAEKGGAMGSITPQQIVSKLQARVPLDVGEVSAKNKAVADKYGVRLIAYEAGQHLVSFAHSDNESYVNKLIAANRDPGMRQVYDTMFDTWFDKSGNDLMTLFAYIAPPSKYGEWGMLESQSQKTEASPKFQSFVDRLHKLCGHGAPAGTVPRE